MPNSLKLFITFLLLFVTISQAQNKSKEVRSEKKPDWIFMMDDPNANFFATVKAFRNYYKDRPLPKEPNEVEGEDRETKKNVWQKLHEFLTKIVPEKAQKINPPISLLVNMDKLAEMFKILPPGN